MGEALFIFSFWHFSIKFSMKTNKNIQSYKSIIYLITLGIFAFWGSVALASSITEMSVLELVNQARIENGREPLAANEKLFKVASDKADDMIKNNYFAHTSPKGTTPWTWFEKEGYDYKFAGENLAINFSSAEDQQKAWMKSETHRKNILDANYREIGLAIKKGVIDGKLTTVTVQEFGTQMAYAGNGPAPGKGEIPFQVKNSLPKVDVNLLQNFNGKLIKAGEDLSGSIMGAKRFDGMRLLDSLGSGTAAIILAIIAINSLILLGIILSSILDFQRKNDGLPASFNLYTISQEEYLEFLKRFSVNPRDVKTIYLEQMKLRR